MLPLNTDFIERLNEYGRLPIDSVDEQLKTLHEKDQKIQKLNRLRVLVNRNTKQKERREENIEDYDAEDDAEGNESEDNEGEDNEGEDNEGEDNEGEDNAEDDNA